MIPRVYDDEMFLRTIHIVPNLAETPEPIKRTSEVTATLRGVFVVCGSIIGSWLFVIGLAWIVYIMAGKL